MPADNLIATVQIGGIGEVSYRCTMPGKPELVVTDKDFSACILRCAKEWGLGPSDPIPEGFRMDLVGEDGQVPASLFDIKRVVARVLEIRAAHLPPGKGIGTAPKGRDLTFMVNAAHVLAKHVQKDGLLRERIEGVIKSLEDRSRTCRHEANKKRENTHSRRRSGTLAKHYKEMAKLLRDALGAGGD